MAGGILRNDRSFSSGGAPSPKKARLGSFVDLSRGARESASKPHVLDNGTLLFGDPKQPWGRVPNDVPIPKKSDRRRAFHTTVRTFGFAPRSAVTFQSQVFLDTCYISFFGFFFVLTIDLSPLFTHRRQRPPRQPQRGRGAP